MKPSTTAPGDCASIICGAHVCIGWACASRILGSFKSTGSAAESLVAMLSLASVSQSTSRSCHFKSCDHSAAIIFLFWFIFLRLSVKQSYSCCHVYFVGTNILSNFHLILFIEFCHTKFSKVAVVKSNTQSVIFFFFLLRSDSPVLYNLIFLLILWFRREII